MKGNTKEHKKKVQTTTNLLAHSTLFVFALLTSVMGGGKSSYKESMEKIDRMKRKRRRGKMKQKGKGN